MTVYYPKYLTNGTGVVLVNNSGAKVTIDATDLAACNTPIFRPAVAPSINGVAMEERPTVTMTKTTDSFTLMGPPGLNHIEGSQRFQWERLDADNASDIVEFFRARGGTEAFWYQLPEDYARLWRCVRWNTRWATYIQWTVSADFVRCNDLVGV